jgi:hypothetical protein
MKRIIATLVLTCALSVSALAGEIPTCSPSPTAAVAGVGSEPVAGEVPTNGSTVSSETESSVLTDVLLTLFDLIVR